MSKSVSRERVSRERVSCPGPESEMATEWLSGMLVHIVLLTVVSTCGPEAFLSPPPDPYTTCDRVSDMERSPEDWEFRLAAYHARV